jgi:hypothetical protein
MAHRGALRSVSHLIAHAAIPTTVMDQTVRPIGQLEVCDLGFDDA